VDASGADVAPTCAPYVLDAQGHAWRVNPETGGFMPEVTLPYQSTTLTDLASLVSFETVDCTGTPYMTFLLAPRVPFLVSSRWRVRADDAASSMHSFRSRWRDDGSCEALPGGPPTLEPGFELDLTRELTAPAAFQGPLHPERRVAP